MASLPSRRQMTLMTELLLGTSVGAGTDQVMPPSRLSERLTKSTDVGDRRRPCDRRPGARWSCAPSQWSQGLRAWTSLALVMADAHRCGVVTAIPALSGREMQRKIGIIQAPSTRRTKRPRMKLPSGSRCRAARHPSEYHLARSDAHATGTRPGYPRAGRCGIIAIRPGHCAIEPDSAPSGRVIAQLCCLTPARRVGREDRSVLWKYPTFLPASRQTTGTPGVPSSIALDKGCMILNHRRWQVSLKTTVIALCQHPIHPLCNLVRRHTRPLCLDAANFTSRHMLSSYMHLLSHQAFWLRQLFNIVFFICLEFDSVMIIFLLRFSLTTMRQVEIVATHGV